MMRFALPYDPDTAPIVDLIGLGYRPSWQPADFIGPRMDCPMWVAAPDADVAMIGKFDPWAAIPASGYAWGTWIPASHAPQITAASLAGPTPAPAVWHPVTPTQPWWPAPGPSYPCHCIVPPVDPLPPVAPVPIPASAGLLIAAVAVLALWRRSC